MWSIWSACLWCALQISGSTAHIFLLRPILFVDSSSSFTKADSPRLMVTSWSNHGAWLVYLDSEWLETIWFWELWIWVKRKIYPASENGERSRVNTVVKTVVSVAARTWVELRHWSQLFFTLADKLIIVRRNFDRMNIHQPRLILLKTQSWKENMYKADDKTPQFPPEINMRWFASKHYNNFVHHPYLKTQYTPRWNWLLARVVGFGRQKRHLYISPVQGLGSLWKQSTSQIWFQDQWRCKMW